MEPTSSSSSAVAASTAALSPIEQQALAAGEPWLSKHHPSDLTDLLRAAVCGGFAAAAPIVERGVAMEALAAFRFSEEDAAAAAALGGASMEY